MANRFARTNRSVIFLRLLNLGDGTALGQYKGQTFQGRWVWRLKNRIDTRFMDRFQDYQPHMATAHDSASRSMSAPKTMRCAGCGGKLPNRTLQSMLQQIKSAGAIDGNERVVLGLAAPDDAAIVQANDQGKVAITTDHFAVPIDDAYKMAQAAVAHSASDAFAIGAKPFAALAHIEIPYGGETWQEQHLVEVMLGATEKLSQLGITLIGGQSIEGPRLSLGFTVLADPDVSHSYDKSKARAGDALVLSKSIGTGVLLAGHMRAKCRAEWLSPLLTSMVRDNQTVAETVTDFDVSAMTDVTGFGLAGHLWEILTASSKSATLNLDAIPLLPGAEQLLQDGIESSIAPSNRHLQGSVSASSSTMRRPTYQALFDPQTSGGLLIAIAEHQAEAFTTKARAASPDIPIQIIGQITDCNQKRPKITVH